MATTIGFFGGTGAGAGFAGSAAGPVLVVGIGAETLSSGASAEDEEESFVAVLEERVAADFFTFEDSVSVALFFDAEAFTADDDVVVGAFTVAVFDAFVFAFVFGEAAFDDVVLDVVGVTDLAGAFATTGFAPFAVLVVFAAVVAAALVAFVTGFAAVLALVAAEVDFAAVDFAADLVSVFLGTAAFFTGADDVAFEPADFLAAAVTLPTADFTPPAFPAVVDFVVAVFLALVVAALGMRSTSQAVRAAPP